MDNTDTRILITGAHGQIGTVLSAALRQKYGTQNVLATDIRPSQKEQIGPFEQLDVLDASRLEALISQYRITQIYHLAAILSAKGEEMPMQTWNINMQGLFNVLEAGRKLDIKRLFFPSSIAAFGPDSPKEDTPQKAYRSPLTVYGISKVAGENWLKYYYKRYGLDVRSLRYPGIIGYQSLPGGGTTDYAVDIFYRAVEQGEYTCFLKANTRLPMIYMDDAIRATLELMEAPAQNLSIHTSYNLAGISFTPAELAAEIRKHLPHFVIRYAPDFRQHIAESWPQTIDDSTARKDWQWQPAFDLKKMVEEMLYHVQKNKSTTESAPML